MIIARGTIYELARHLYEKPRDVRGISSCMVKVTVNVVIRILSAAGSRIVPRTEDMLYRRAKTPSSLIDEERNIRIRPKKTPRATDHTNQVCQTRVDQ